MNPEVRALLEALKKIKETLGPGTARQCWFIADLALAPYGESTYPQSFYEDAENLEDLRCQP